MGTNIWNDDEPFRDGAPVYEGGKWKEPETYTPASDTEIKNEAARASQESYNVEELVQEVVDNQEDEDDSFEEAMTDATLRLEQGKLYKLIMDHNLFEDVDADPRAAAIVQKQIRKIAKELMETMLGMRQPAAPAGVVVSPFNSLEVDILKQLASAATKGATESEEAQASMPEPVRQPMAQPKKKTLNSIGSPKQQPKPVQKPISKPVAPIQRTAKPKNSLPAEFEPDYKPLEKPAHEMTSEEIMERNREATERQKGKVAALPKDRVPMPDYATQEMLAFSQVSRATATGKGNLSGLIMANLKSAGKV